MTKLVASDLRQRETIRHQWSLVPDVDLPLGRTVSNDQLQTAWDERIAPWHAVVRWQDDRLAVKRRPETSAHSPIVYGGRDLAEFEIVPGEGFVIGSTIFRLETPRESQSLTAPRASSRTQFFDIGQLRTQINDDHEMLEVVYELIRQVQDQQLDVSEIEHHVVDMLMRSVRRAEFGAILHVAEDRITTDHSEGKLAICEPLVRDAVAKQKLISQRWGTKEEASYPAVARAAWAVCAPIVTSLASEGDYAIYLSGGRLPAAPANAKQTLPEDQLSLIAIVADILQNAHSFSSLAEGRQSLEVFLPKPVRNLLRRCDPSEVLRTEQVDAAILFCDLRGSSQFAVNQQHDLEAAWNRIEEALGLMTEAITNQYGSIGDFQGDAAMGFWGWPQAQTGIGRQMANVQSACQAADMLRERFQQRTRAAGPMAGFACGIGIAAGRVVAGMLGTVDQRKIGVFGPAVNLAARLETMTKQWGVSILVDAEAQQTLVQAGSDFVRRLRYLAEVQPAGLDSGVRIYDLMPPADDPAALNAKQLKLFDYGRKTFEEGKWSDARSPLEQLTTAGDGPSKFLVRYMDQLQTPPAGWKGRVVLTAK